MSSSETTRRRFFEDVAKYCGAGMAALGLGRSIYGLFDRHLIAYALENIKSLKDPRLTNYGAFLEENPPRHLVEIGRVNRPEVLCMNSHRPVFVADISPQHADEFGDNFHVVNIWNIAKKTRLIREQSCHHDF